MKFVQKNKMKQSACVKLSSKTTCYREQQYIYNTIKKYSTDKKKKKTKTSKKYIK